VTRHRLEIVTPAPPREVHNGNRTTAERWRRLLAELGHDVVVTDAWSGEPADVLVVLHARKSAESAERFAAAHPDRALVVALTGTDLYRDLDGAPEAQRVLRRADALVVLQERGVARVPAELRDRVHVIHQSVVPPAEQPPPRDDVFEVAVVAHLREVKDPFLAARAVRRLPAESAVEVVHVGAPLDDGSREEAEQEDAINPRWRWLGEHSHEETLRLVGRARLLAITSRLEGGANVVTEAAAVGTPVVATRIDGSVGLLGDDHPGYVPVGDADALATALRRAETDPVFYAALQRSTDALRPLVEPAAERSAWDRLLAKLA
jgi:putative glycosyltransferase (TIGR04348 family)